MTAAADLLPHFKWPVKVSRTIAAPTSKAWEMISSPGTLPLYHPFCEKNPVYEWPGTGSHDEIHYFNGVVLNQRKRLCTPAGASNHGPRCGRGRNPRRVGKGDGWGWSRHSGQGQPTRRHPTAQLHNHSLSHELVPFHWARSVYYYPAYSRWADAAQATEGHAAA